MPESSKSRIGNYELLELIGGGGEGRVYKAVCIADGVAGVSRGELVALKRLHHIGDHKEPALFQRQAEILRHLNHPNIVRYKDSFVPGEDDWGEERYCLVTELLEGKTLKSLLEENPKGLPWEQARDILSQTLQALQYASKRGVVHRDLKPSNIYVTREGTVKLIDFGIARREEGGSTTASSAAGIKGSFDYMAPDFVRLHLQGQENFRGDERSDIFSVGVCFYQVLTGQFPFPPLSGNTYLGYLNRWHPNSMPPKVNFRDENFRDVFPVLRHARSCIAKCIDPNRDARLQSFDAVLADFARIGRIKLQHDADVYEFVELLGKGGFGEVFRARRLRDGCDVAVKRLLMARQSRRFVREAKILQHAVHPNLVKYVDFVEVDRGDNELQYFLVLEYLKGMPGASLRDRIKQSESGLDLVEALRLFMGYLDCLEHLHQRDIIHRDIKPANLYAPADDPGNGKIFDLGVALDVEGTRTRGQVPGTLDYMPPEFATQGSERGSPQSDIYSIGVSLYQSLTKKLPFPRLPDNEPDAWIAYYARAEKPVECPFDHPVFKEHPELIPLLRRAMAHDPHRRYARAREMGDEIRGLLETWSRRPGDTSVSEAETTRTQTAERDRLAKAEQEKREQAERERRKKDEREKREKAERAEIDKRKREELERQENEELEKAERLRQEKAQAAEARRIKHEALAARARHIGRRVTMAGVAVLLAAGLVVALRYGWNGLELRKLARAEQIAQELENSPAVSFPLDKWVTAWKQAESKAQANRPDAGKWRGIADKLSVAGRRFPSALSNAFATAVSRSDATEAQQLLGKWKEAQPLASSVDVSEENHRRMEKWMQVGLDRLLFPKVVLTSVPPGAEVFLQGNRLGRMEPQLATNLPLGTHEFRAQYTFTAPHTNLVEQTKTLVIELGKQPEPVNFHFPHGKVRLTSDPNVADVKVDGEKVGTTPFKSDAWPTGTVSLVLTKRDPKGDLQNRVELAVRDGDEVTRDVKLRPPEGRLVLNSDPSGAEVRLDGKPVGTTPHATGVWPAGQITYELSTATHAGTVTVTVPGNGEVLTTNVTLGWRQGTVVVNSDPIGAQVWVGGQQRGETPKTLLLTVGTQMLTLKRPGLEDRALTVAVVADQSVQTNVVFAYGGVLIQSEPTGATVTWNGQAVGQTPYTTNVVRPGAASWQLAAEDHLPANVTVHVADHETKTVRVTLERGRATLALTSNSDRAKAWLDGVSVGALPTNLLVEAGSNHTVVAACKGQWLTNSPVRVKMNETKGVTFKFEEFKTWTNRLGMAFVLLPGAGFWAGTAQVTTDQYARVMNSTLSDEHKGNDRGRPCITSVSCTDAKSFAASLRTHGTPPGCDSCQFTIPTTNQWRKLADIAEDIGIADLRGKYGDWCMTDAPAGASAYGKFVSNRIGDRPEKPDTREFPDKAHPLLTIRVVIVPR